MEKKKRKKITMHGVLTAATRFATRTEFCRECPSEYDYAWRNGLLDSVCAHMQISPRYSYHKWEREPAFAEAKKYKSRSEFKRENSGAFCYLLDSQLLDEACAHMAPLHNIWSGRDVAAEAQKYTRRSDFKKFSFSAYRHAQKTGVLDAVCAHMAVCRRDWSKDSVIAEAQKYLYRGEFHGSCPGGYKHAVAGDYLDEACAHMADASCGFDFVKPATLYVLEVSIPGRDALCKIGITNRSARLRIRGMGISRSAKVAVLHEIVFASGREARAKERQLHTALSEFRYLGPPIMGNGNTELFSRDAQNSPSLQEISQGVQMEKTP